MVVTHWEMINGSPKRTWRYMSDIYNDNVHWWETKTKGAHIVVQRPKVYKPRDIIQWEVTFYRSGGPTVTHHSAMPLPELKRIIIARENKRNA